MSSQPPSSLLSTETQTRIEQAVRQCIKDAEQWLDVSLPDVDILFNIKGSAWAYYQRKDQQRSIRFNPYLVRDHLQETISDVVPHETAHFVVDSYYRKRCRPHGQEWRQVMRHFGIPNPSIRHQKDISQIPVRRQTRHTYRCNCRDYELTATRHNRIVRGTQRYSCRQCGETLKAV